MAEILDYDTISDMGNIMRSKRNMDFYGGGIEVTEKKCAEYIKFVEDVLQKLKIHFLHKEVRSQNSDINNHE